MMQWKVPILILIAVATVGCRGCQRSSWTAADVSMSLASIPAQVCISVNEARPEILRAAGDSLHARALAEGWSSAQEVEAVTALHEQDNILREIVSPAFARDGEQVQGLCRVVTTTMEDLSHSVGAWEDFDANAWGRAVAETITLMNSMIEALEALGVADVYGWLDGKAQIAGMGLGEALRSFFRLANLLLESGGTGLMEAER